MACTDNVCGTGGWTGPKPGDPDNNITLQASSVYGGINVHWTYPGTNPHAVAHTILYRGHNSSFVNAVKQGEIAGSRYYDKLDPAQETEYYYWIQIVTINGTVNDVIGPAMAIAKPIAEWTLESLTGKIDAGKLAQELKTAIAGITLNNAAIYDEINDRLAANLALQTALAAVQSDTEEALTYILQETTARTDQDTAMVTQINAIAAGLGQNAAAIVEERNIRVSKDAVMAEDILTLYGEVEDANGAIIQERSLRITADEAIIEDYNALYGRVGTAEGAILDISNLTIAPGSALATKLTSLTTNVNNAASAVNTLSTSLSNGTHALAVTVDTVEARVFGSVSTGEVGLSAEVNSITGELDVMYFAKLEANGLVGGFGLWNNGNEVQAGFDVDTFWIGRTNANKVKPFIVDNDTVYINKARIKDADIDTLKIAGNAVTVPLFTSSGSPINEGFALTINIYVPYAAHYICVAAAKQSYSGPSGGWYAAIQCDGSPIFTITGDAIADSLSLCGGAYLSAGNHTFVLFYEGSSNQVLQDRTMFVMAAMK